MISRAVILPVYKEDRDGLKAVSQIQSQLGEADRLYVVVTGHKHLGHPTADDIANLVTDRSRLTIIEAPGAFPGAARNVAIKQAEDADIIVQIDAGQHIGPDWLEVLTRPILEDRLDYTFGPVAAFEGASHLWGLVVDREALFYSVLCYPTLERLRKHLSAEFSQEGELRDPGLFRRLNLHLAGGAPVAYRRRLWVAVGGFPEDLRVGEDKVFAAGILATDARISPVLGAVSRWQLGPTFSDMLRREYFYRYHDYAFRGQRVPRRKTLGDCLLYGLPIGALVLFGLPGFGLVVAAELTLAGLWARYCHGLYRKCAREIEGENQGLIGALLLTTIVSICFARSWGAIRGGLTRVKWMLAEDREIRGRKGGSVRHAVGYGLNKILSQFYRRASYSVLSVPLDLKLGKNPEGITSRPFEDRDVALFSRYFKNFGETSKRWREAGAKGLIIMRDGVPMGQIWTASGVLLKGEGEHPFFKIDIDVGTSCYYYYCLFVLPGHRGVTFRSLLSYGIYSGMERKPVYMLVNDESTRIKRLWLALGFKEHKTLTARRYFRCFVRKHTSTLRLPCA